MRNAVGASYVVKLCCFVLAGVCEFINLLLHPALLMILWQYDVVLFIYFVKY